MGGGVGGLRAGLALPQNPTLPRSQGTEASRTGKVVLNGELTGTPLVPTLGTSQPSAAQRRALGGGGDPVNRARRQVPPNATGTGGRSRCAHSSRLPAARKNWPPGKIITGRSGEAPCCSWPGEGWVQAGALGLLSSLSTL